MSEEITDESLNNFNDRHDYWASYLEDWVKKNPTRSNGVENMTPHKAITALMMFEEGATRKSVRQKLGWNPTTCHNFEVRHTLSIQENRKKFSQEFAHTVHEGLRVANKKWQQLLANPEALAKTSPKDIAIAIGVYTDKGAMMDGMATQTIEVRKSGVDMNDALAMIQESQRKVQEKGKIIDAEIIA